MTVMPICSPNYPNASHLMRTSRNQTGNLNQNDQDFDEKRLLYPHHEVPVNMFPEIWNFSDPYFTTQLITYIGNKRSLLPFINQAIADIKHILRKDKLCIFEGFSGSGAVSRLLKYHASQLFVNDLEDYCEILNKCYLANKSEIDVSFISETIQWLNQNKFNDFLKSAGFIEQNYAPKNDDDIKHGERVFYTNQNAKIIDNLKYLINSKIRREYRHFLIAPLIVEASIHTNTSGVFKGFHKKNGNGCFGGAGENALTRIKGEIHLDAPVFSDMECEINIFKQDVNELIKSLQIANREFDLVYYDPPYNQHPYGSNYFMLNIIADEQEKIEIQNGVSGIAKNWNRSFYNKTREAEEALDELIKNTPSKYILLSYNDEGSVPVDRIKLILANYGRVELRKKEYNTYRGSRNLCNRNIKVQELLWILKRN